MRNVCVLARGHLPPSFSGKFHKHQSLRQNVGQLRSYPTQHLSCQPNKESMGDEDWDDIDVGLLLA